MTTRLTVLTATLLLAGCGAHRQPTLTPAQRFQACVGHAASSDREFRLALNALYGDFVGNNIVRHCLERIAP